MERERLCNVCVTWSDRRTVTILRHTYTLPPRPAYQILYFALHLFNMYNINTRKGSVGVLEIHFITINITIPPKKKESRIKIIYFNCCHEAK